MSSPLSHLRDHRHIESTLHLWKDIETTSHYPLHYHYLTSERSTLLNSIKEVGPINLTKNDSCKIDSCLLQK